MASRLSQHTGEVLRTTTLPGARLTQQVVEVLTPLAPPVTPARLTQHVLETLARPPVSQSWLTQHVVEVLMREAVVPHCEPLPAWIAYGATGGPEWGTALFAAPGGWEQRAQMFAQVRGRWDVSFINVSKAQATVLVDFFRAVAHGRAGSFCFTDWRDYTFANVIGTGDGTTSAFQLVKVYTSGTLSYARPLTRPIVSRLVVTVNGVLTSAYTVTEPGGMVQFDAPPPSGAVIHASGDFEVLVRFETDQLMVTCVAPNVFSCAGLGLVELIGE
jgi:uncharacterized protein (TIGR02217 family)